MVQQREAAVNRINSVGDVDPRHLNLSTRRARPELFARIAPLNQMVVRSLLPLFPTEEGGEGRGEEDFQVELRGPLSPALSPLVLHGARGTKCRCEPPIHGKGTVAVLLSDSLNGGRFDRARRRLPLHGGSPQSRDREGWGEGVRSVSSNNYGFGRNVTLLAGVCEWFLLQSVDPCHPRDTSPSRHNCTDCGKKLSGRLRRFNCIETSCDYARRRMARIPRPRHSSIAHED